MACRPSSPVRVPDYRVPSGNTLSAESLLDRWYDQLAWIHKNLLGHTVPARRALKHVADSVAFVYRRDDCGSATSHRLDYFASNASHARESRPRTSEAKGSPAHTKKSRARSASPAVSLARKHQQRGIGRTRAAEAPRKKERPSMSEYGDRELTYSPTSHDGANVLKEFEPRPRSTSAEASSCSSRQESRSGSRSPTISPSEVYEPRRIEPSGVITDRQMTERSAQTQHGDHDELDGGTPLDDKGRIYPSQAVIEKLPDLGVMTGPGPHFSVFAKPRAVEPPQEPVEVVVEAETPGHGDTLIENERQLKHSFANDVSRLCSLITALLPGPLETYDKVYITRSGWELRRSELRYSKPRGQHCLHVFDVASLDDVQVTHDVIELRVAFDAVLLDHYREQLLPILGDCYATLERSSEGSDAGVGLLKINAHVPTSYTEAAVDHFRLTWMKLLLVWAIVRLDSDRAARRDHHRVDVRIASRDLRSVGESLETALSSTIRKTVAATLYMSPR
ncbi:hypothetical protein FOZ62_024007 [Perkinsus olseni]|uniref:Uncharacterized protein n=2 Tax=Perkinsus olseni TaxID=32597 RepID=A0A7J6PVI3_PEROL|nr:hypothetical protein FOZ62_024007 [Perkinsus olseni]